MAKSSSWLLGFSLRLQINNWNENRKANANQLKYLILLKKEAQNNITNIDVAANRMNKLIDAQKLVFHLIDQPKDTLTESYTSQILFNSFTVVAKFNYENSVLTEIKNSGELKNIKNDNLRKVLIALEPYYETVKSQENDVNILQDLIVKYINLNGDLRLVLEHTDYYKQLGIGKAKAKSKGNKSVLNDDYFKNTMIEYLALTLNLNDRLYPNLKNQLIDIVAKIDKEIEANYK